MSGKTLVLAMTGVGGQWAPERWRQRFQQALPDITVEMVDEARAAPDRVHYAAAWKAVPGSLAGFGQLKAIFNLGAGVDALLADRTVPSHVPIFRVVSDDLTSRMVEYVTLQVLAVHRRSRQMASDQRARRWAPPDQPSARHVRVGILGLGELGRASASVLRRLGFQVLGWSRRAQTVPDVTTFAGTDGLDAMLQQTDILVALLPLTPDTRGILNRALFAKLARDGVLGAPEIINAGRGGLQVEADILAALADGTLGGATLDVFAVEPLPAEHPFWAHPKVTITPHNAADSDPDVLAGEIAEAIRTFERGGQPRGLIDRATSY